jgi:SAM-dependent methyltransferase
LTRRAIESEPAHTAQRIFFQVFESLPRQGPGNRACTARALALCEGLAPRPRILDLGCGSGAQTLHLAELTDGKILAVDSHPPNIARLQATLAERGLAHRVEATVADMARLALPERFDLVWSEGAFYNIGIGAALGVCAGVLSSGGFVAFTDAVWRRAGAPAEVRAAFADYPTMGTVNDVLEVIAESGFSILGHFPLPDAAWWDDFYTPMERRIETLRRRSSGDTEAIAALDELAREPELYRRHGDTFGYEFFIARR